VTGADVGGDGAPARAAAGLVGRAEELAVLRQAVEVALTGRPALAIVEGEPGVGRIASALPYGLRATAPYAPTIRAEPASAGSGRHSGIDTRPGSTISNPSKHAPI